MFRAWSSTFHTITQSRAKCICLCVSYSTIMLNLDASGIVVMCLACKLYSDVSQFNIERNFTGVRRCSTVRPLLEIGAVPQLLPMMSGLDINKYGSPACAVAGGRAFWSYRIICLIDCPRADELVYGSPLASMCACNSSSLRRANAPRTI